LKKNVSSLDALTKISDLTVDKAKQDILGTDKSGGAAGSNKKLLLYGGIGLGVLVAIALIARR
jgi:hypothetical protein